MTIVLFLALIRDRGSAGAGVLGFLYGLGYGLGTMHSLVGLFGALAISFMALMAGYFGLLATLIGLTRAQRSGELEERSVSRV